MTHIELDNCGLRLPVYGANNRSLKQAALTVVSRGRIAPTSRNITYVDVLRNISLGIDQGDRVGLIGPNGAGKTSLLRVLSGIYEPTSGRIDVVGRVTNLIDVTLGMDFEATGYENILIRGLILGLSRQEIQRLTPSIVEFSGLGDYLHMPLRVYSSGMILRLAFSIVTSVDADILLMDEWLSVGDAEFVERAETRLESLVGGASILVLASHNPRIISDLCNRVVTLEGGQIVG